jgi:hypothetical protein
MEPRIGQGWRIVPSFRSPILERPPGRISGCYAMGLYENWVLPRLLDLTMRNQTLDPYRPGAITSARGLVLEIGVGSGLNLSLYGPAADSVVGLDPRPEASAISPISTDHRFRRR